MADPRRQCRCLLHEAGEKEIAQSIRDYVDSLDETIRTPEDAYRARLDVCLNCPHLLNGTCRLCGCYVETRAAKKNQKCPDVPARWGRMAE